MLRNVTLSVKPSECVGHTRPSGAGKSTLMGMIYGNNLTKPGKIKIGDLELGQAKPREVIALRAWLCEPILSGRPSGANLQGRRRTPAWIG
ncbi:MAG: ATP-binding cassette domain-containing protein [Roseobacter sp.]